LSRTLTEGGPEEAVAQIRGTGAWLFVPPDDCIGAAVHSFGDVDHKVTWVSQRILRPGDAALGIGANLGLVAIAMADAVGTRGHFEAFEPKPRFAELARRSAEPNRFDQLTLHEVALGRTNAGLTLDIPNENMARASIGRSQGADEAMQVLQRQAGEVLEDLALGPIRLIKMDVEGYETEIIAGAEGYLRRNPPNEILFEINEYHGAFGEQELVIQLNALGYPFVEIPRCLWRMRLRPNDPASAGELLADDTLAVRLDAKGDAILAQTNAY